MPRTAVLAAEQLAVPKQADAAVAMIESAAGSRQPPGS
jgi:hypothetical protein